MCRSWPLPCCCWPCHHLSVFFLCWFSASLSIMPMSDCCDSSSFSSVHTIRRFTATYIGKPNQKHFTPRKHLHQRTFAPALYTCAFYTTSSSTPEAEDFYTSRTLQNPIGNIHGNPGHSSTNKDENDAWRQRHPGMQKNPMENALSIWGSSSARPMTPWSDQELVIPCRFWTTEHSFWSPAISQNAFHARLPSNMEVG